MVTFTSKQRRAWIRFSTGASTLQGTIFLSLYPMHCLAWLKTEAVQDHLNQISPDIQEPHWTHGPRHIELLIPLENYPGWCRHFLCVVLFDEASFISILPSRGPFAVRLSKGDASVLLAVDIPSLLVLDAHVDRVSQLQVEHLRGVGVHCRQAAVLKLQILSVLAWKKKDMPNKVFAKKSCLNFL